MELFHVFILMRPEHDEKEKLMENKIIFCQNDINLCAPFVK